MTTPIESLTPGEGAPLPEATQGEFVAWNMRQRLPSEHSHRVALRWPDHVTDVTGIPAPTLKKMRADGDCPRLYALGRALFTTRDDLRVWFEAHEIAAGQTLRPATVPRGTRLAPRAAAGPEPAARRKRIGSAL